MSDAALLKIAQLKIGQKLLALAAAAAGGFAASRTGMPLPWVLGSMLGVAVLSLMGAQARQPPQARRAAQVVVGLALGLTFTPEVVRQIAALGHLMLLGAGFALVLTAIFAPVIQRLARLDGPTAIYSVAVGASAEMASQAQRAGADGPAVASSHAIRIICVVGLASIVARLSGQPALVFIGPGIPVLDWELALGLALLGPFCGWLASRIRMPNAWLLGPMLLTAAVAASGTSARMFSSALIAAQILIGWNLGQHLTRGFFMKAPRLLAAASVVTFTMVGLCVLVAWGFSNYGQIPLLTAFLSLAPGGTAEMTILAKTYGIGAPVVAAFHFFRIVSTVLLIGGLVQLLLRTGWVQRSRPV